MFKVSFCIPVYGHAKETEKLVNDLLQNPNPNFQIVLSDDASKDDMLERLEQIQDSRVKIVAQDKNGGRPSLNWYHALEAGDGEYLYLVMGQDYLNAESIDKLIDFLEKAKKQSIKLVLDTKAGRCYTDEVGEWLVYRGEEALRRSLDCLHPTGMIVERMAYRQIKRRKERFCVEGTVYPENYIKCEVLRQSPIVAKTLSGMWTCVKNYRLSKKRSGWRGIAYYTPKESIKDYIRIINLVEKDNKFKLSEKERDMFFFSKYEHICHHVSFMWKVWQNSGEMASHYGYKCRTVSKCEMVKNLVNAYGAISNYYPNLSLTRKVNMMGITMKWIMKVLIGINR